MDNASIVKIGGFPGDTGKTLASQTYKLLISVSKTRNLGDQMVGTKVKGMAGDKEAWEHCG